VQKPEESFQVVKTGSTAAQPFAPEDAPITLRTKARRIPQWKLESNGMVGEVQPGPVKSGEPVEEVTLIPMGAARLRISSFPQIGEGGEAHTWDGPAPMVQASGSSHFEPPSAVLDGLVPANSADRSIPRFVWGPGTGGRGEAGRWIEYRYPEPRTIGSAEVYWAADADGSGCTLPASWQIVWWDGSAWKPVDGVAAYPTEKDKFNQVRFSPTRTNAIRLQVMEQGRRPAGILEWRVSE
jgi:hypothetical protein